MSEIRLTEYSHGAGCGCKIAPAVLDTILAQTAPGPHFPSLLVGNGERDDAAVYDLGDGTAIISTTDFFMPIVDDPLTFGRIAATNAISDVYAMGGTPLLAIAILGWPINLLAPEVAGLVVEGGRQACADAGIPLAGGHSIDCPEPIFGLAVNGRIDLAHLKKNGGAHVGDILFLTKPIGVGILSTAQKQKKLRAADAHLATEQMVRLNKIGAALGTREYVHAMTDVTGFGLLGHLTEMCRASAASALVRLSDVPLIDADILDYYLAEGCIPGGTKRNWDSYGAHVKLHNERAKWLLADPQTSGGLLCAVAPDQATNFRAFCADHGHVVAPLGEIIPRQADYLVAVD
ncbi:selenide, water dikinase SelD [Neolewinella lacunae]|uniref:Selenide, water dikinase n=1 Tax=Neolewinella lacunae TaxID=1517758 RepID=A0A923PSM7_9BACT|nr:selenide, water dikinase SelD [Neolewinella lacunae]MBC6996052.1 selenide, water dikinase SelD [Neolewinella lacunae]MDN3636828.1 selenide, water dikinase SelD [Neolewinella lacunae]